VASCGDGVCAASEACESCAADCGECETPPVTECNDGIDNDGDGLVDWAEDVGCWSELDTTEAGGAADADSGFTTFDLSDDSLVVYVSSSEGDDSNDGLSPDSPVATPARGAELVRDGYPDFLLFRRGDSWRAMDIGPDRVVRRFKSGRDPDHKMVVYSYGDSTERPRLEIDKPFIDDDGNERNYLAIVGLSLISYPKVPSDPEFNGTDGGGVRFVGTGHDILVEDNYVEYGEFVAQNVTDISFRRNVVYRSYQVGTCATNADGSRDANGNSDIRPSGIFAGSVDGLTIDSNVFDENGWNPDVPEACATIYNHDMYLSGNQRLRVRDNLVLRASSIGIKMSSSGPSGSSDIVIENNLFAEGEIGISMGGNADTEYRFTDAVVRDNVFTDIGRSQPTTRTLSWYVEILDNDGTEISGNLFVNQPQLGNPFGLRLGNASNRDITVADNLFHGIERRSLWLAGTDAWEAISVTGNTFVSTSDEDCMIAQDGPFAPTMYADNQYQSAAAQSSWFCADGARLDLDGWRAAANEDSATAVAFDAPEPNRNLDTYAASLGIGSTLADFAENARVQSRHRYRPELDAANANNYIREGFGRELR
jgi:hypothetical protein